MMVHTQADHLLQLINTMSFMPPTLKKLEGLVCMFEMVKARVLKFHTHIPHEKIVDPYFFHVQVMPPFFWEGEGMGGGGACSLIRMNMLYSFMSLKCEI